MQPQASPKETPWKLTKTLSLLGVMIRKHSALYVLNCVLWIIFHNIQILGELPGREYFNLLEQRPNAWSIQWVIALTLIMAVLRVVIYLVASFVDARHRFLMRSIPLRNLMHLVFRHPGADILRVPASEAVSTLRNESETIENTLSYAIDVVGQLISLAVGLYILTSIDAKLTIVVYIPLLFVIFLSQWLEKLFQNARDRTQEASAAIGELIGDVFNSIQIVQIAGAEEPVLRHLQELAATRRKLVLQEKLNALLLDGCLTLSFTLITAYVLWVSTSNLLADKMTIGDLLIFINYIDILTENTVSTGVSLVTLAQSTTSFKRLFALARPEHPDLLVSSFTDSSQQPVLEPLRHIEVRNLSFAYEGTDKGIRDVSFHLHAGSINVITGSIGSGKTTLLRTLLGLLEADEGTILWNDIPVEHPQHAFVPPYSAYVPQIPTLLSASIAENIALQLDIRSEETESVLDSVDFMPDLQRLSEGLQTRIGNRGTKLSGGQVQRVATARALLRAPELLVVDDLSSALDITTEQNIWRNLPRYSNTILMVSHSQQAFRLADHILLMEQGRIVDSGTYQQLLETSETFRGLWKQSSQEAPHTES